MKIVHTSSGLPYQLKPGTQLEVERTNLFFNEWGEQTLPIELPDTDRNRELLGFPDSLGNSEKPSTQVNVSIEDGEYFMSCRQAILGAKRKSGISTSFYMNEGSFLAKISDTSLLDIFGNEIIPGITTVEQGIQFCRSLVSGNNPNFAIFPVLIDSDESFSNGYPKYKFINRYGSYDENGRWRDYIIRDVATDFYNVTSRSEVVDGSTITLSPGYYISPFIRGNYLLRRIFQFFGYDLKDNFFTKTFPFPDMVFINNCADSLVNGSIRLIDLLPECSCSTILNVYRKKFCCEFIPDELNKVVNIKLFNESIVSEPIQDLTAYVTSEPEVSFPGTYQRIVLSSEDKVSDGASLEEPNSISDIANRYQYIKMNLGNGTIYRTGFSYSGMFMLSMPLIVTIKDKIAPSSMKYNVGDSLKANEITVPDLLPEFRDFYERQNPDDYGGVGFPDESFLYIGSANYLNSKLLLNKSDSSSEADVNTSTDNKKLKPMLAFSYRTAGYPRGTITNYVEPDEYSIFGEMRRLSDYSLCYNGDDGIFERFYRKMDDIYRNSLHKVKVPLLLPEALKQSLNAHEPVLLKNQKLLINKFKYLVGGKHEHVDTELLTFKLYEPISSARAFSDFTSGDGHVWIDKNSLEEISYEEYVSSPYKDKNIDTIFPERPTAALAIPGKRYYEQKTYITITYPGGKPVYRRLTIWLECI